MTELASTPARRMSFNGFLGGRFNRTAYWGGVGALTAIGVALELLGFKGGSGTSGVMLFLLIRRLHDFNRSGWWSLAILLGPLVPMLALMPIVAPTVAAAVAVLLSLVWTVWVGVIPGDAFENRFGPPMSGRSLKDIFS